MKSALVVGAACELGGPAIAGGGETDCCALAVTVASAQRQITSMKRFIRRASHQNWMKNQSNRFLKDSAPMGGQVAKIREAGWPKIARVFDRNILHRCGEMPTGT